MTVFYSQARFIDFSRVGEDVEFESVNMDFVPLTHALRSKGVKVGAMSFHHPPEKN